METNIYFPRSKVCHPKGKQRIFSLVLKHVTQVERKAIYIPLFLKSVTRVEEKAVRISLVLFFTLLLFVPLVTSLQNTYKTRTLTRMKNFDLNFTPLDLLK